MEFKRQTNRATKMDRTTNINLFFKGGFEFGVCNSKGWGDFSEDNSNNPMIDIELDGKNYGMRLDIFKEILRRKIEKR